jgi:hypothetical protein
MKKSHQSLKFALFVLSILALLSLACMCSSVTDLADEFVTDPGSGSEDSGSSGGIVLLEDDFSSSNSGWEVGEWEDGSVGYGNGYYFVRSTIPSMTIWGMAGQNYTDVIIEVEATQAEAGLASDNDYGVACRVQENGDGYYLLVSGDGYYSIFKGAGDSFIPLADWKESKAINQGNSRNHIQGSCIGSELVLTANGKKLASASDSTFTSGDIAMTATTYEEQAVEVHFDNVVVTKP